MTADYTILEQSDNKALVISDASDWTGAPGIDPTDLDGINYKLMLRVKINTADQSIQYNDINLTTLESNPGPWVDSAAMVFTITPNMLVSTEQLNDIVDSSLVSDGVYYIEYSVIRVSDLHEYSTTKKILINGVVRNKVYSNLKAVPKIYDAYDYRGKEIDDALLQYALLKSQEAGAWVALEKELLNTLDTLQKILVNGANYTWK
jgi:hypothetical protein